MDYDYGTGQSTEASEPAPVSAAQQQCVTFLQCRLKNNHAKPDRFAPHHTGPASALSHAYLTGPSSPPRHRKMDLGFDSDEMDEMDSDSPTGSPTGSPSKNKSGGEVEMLNQMLEVERAGLVAAKSELVESEQNNRALQRKFDQLKSSTSGQMAFMRKKLEEQYQKKLDEMEAELDESRDETEAMRLQMQTLIEHVESTGADTSALVATSSASQGDSRHVEKLKKELLKQGDTLRRYESELASIRSTQILPAAAECAAAASGVQELQSQLAASQAEVTALRKSGGGGGGGGGGDAALQAEVSRLTQELRVAKMQAASSKPAPAPTSSAVSAHMPLLVRINVYTCLAIRDFLTSIRAMWLPLAGDIAAHKLWNRGHAGPDENAQPAGEHAAEIERSSRATRKGGESDH
jgi:hypothetical protein